MNKKQSTGSGQPLSGQVWLWLLYDFANSLAFALVSFYFALWLVDNLGATDFWVSAPVALATVALLFTLPFLGALSDRSQRRLPYLRAFTLLAVAALAALGLVAGRTGGGAGGLLLIAALYGLFQYAFQASLAFYHPFLHRFATPSLTRERLSGLGMAAGYAGNIVGLIVALPFAKGEMALLGVDGRPATFLLGAILFLLCSLPVLLKLRDDAPVASDRRTDEEGAALSLAGAWRQFKGLKQHPTILWFLLAYYCFADALLTLQLFLSLYLERVGELDDAAKTATLLLTIVALGIGALISHRLARKPGGAKRALAMLALTLCGFLALFALSHGRPMLTVSAMGAGFAMGALFALARAFFSRLIPGNRHGELFGLYVLFERFASIAGPLLWSTTVFVFAFLGDTAKFRLAVLSLALLIGLGALALRRVPSPAD